MRKLLASLGSLSLLTVSAHAEIIYLGLGDTITRYDTDTNTELDTVRFQGALLTTIDFNPANGELYGIGGSPGHSSPRYLYHINLTTGAATQVGDALPELNSGRAFDMSFIPSSGLIRVVSDSGKDLLIDPSNGALLPPGADLDVSMLGYSAGFMPGLYGMSGSTLVRIDEASGALAPLFDTSRLPMPFWGAGFAVSSTSGRAYGYYDTAFGNVSGELLSMDLITGETKILRETALNVFSVAIPVPEPATGVMLLLGSALLGWRYTRRHGR